MEGGIFFWGGVPYPIFLGENLLVRVKLGHPLNFNFLGKPLLGEKYVEGKRRKKERRIMPSLVATTSAPARKPFVRTHYVRTNNNAKFSGHFVCPRTHYVCTNFIKPLAQQCKLHKVVIAQVLIN